MIMTAKAELTLEPDLTPETDSDQDQALTRTLTDLIKSATGVFESNHDDLQREISNLKESLQFAIENNPRLANRIERIAQNTRIMGIGFDIMTTIAQMLARQHGDKTITNQTKE